jgi:hypothetical protein
LFSPKSLENEPLLVRSFTAAAPAARGSMASENASARTPAQQSLARAQERTHITHSSSSLMLGSVANHCRMTAIGSKQNACRGFWKRAMSRHTCRHTHARTRTHGTLTRTLAIILIF